MSSRRVILVGTARKGRADLGAGIRGLGDYVSGSRQEESGMVRDTRSGVGGGALKGDRQML